MSNLNQFFSSGGIKPSLITNRSATFVISSFTPAQNGVFGGTKVASGACTANTLKTILSVTGQGAISALAVTVSSTATHRIKITLDGAVIYDNTSPAGDTSGALLSIIGGVSQLGDPAGNISAHRLCITEGLILRFDSSLLIEYASSVTETDKAAISYRYYLR